MKRREFFGTALTGVAGAAAVAATGMSTQAIGAEKIRLRMQTYWGKEADTIFDTYTDNVKIATDGAIRIQRFTGGAIVPDAEMMKAVAGGTIDMCEGYGGYWPGEVDMAAIESGLPGSWTSYDEARHIFETKGLGDLAREAYAEKNVHYFGPVFGGNYDLITKNPVKNLDDLKTMKIRATPTVASVLQKLGIPTVFMPGSELYVGLGTGAIDGVIYGGASEYKQLKLFEAAKYYTSLNIVDPGYTDNVLMNLDKWKSLSPANQKIMTMAFETHAGNLHNWIVGDNMQAASEGIMKFSKLSSEDTARLVAAAQSVWDDEAKKSPRAAKGIEILRNVAKAAGRL